MNIITPNNAAPQEIRFTPRYFDGSTPYLGFRYMVEGRKEVIEVEALLISHEGSFTTVSLVIDIPENTFIWFQVFTLDELSQFDREIYRGKAVAVTVSEPLKYSIYG